MKCNELGWVCDTYGGELRGAYGVLVGRPDGNRLLGKHRHRWEGDVLEEIGREREIVLIWLMIWPVSGYCDTQ